MSARTIAVAAVFGISALAVSGCVESGGYVESGGHYGGYHRSRTVVIDRDRDHRNDRPDRNDWRRDHDRDHRSDRRDHDRNHDWSRSNHNDHCRDPRSRECRDRDHH